MRLMVRELSKKDITMKELNEELRGESHKPMDVEDLER